MSDQLNANHSMATSEAQSWVARSISIKQELQAKCQGLQDSVHKSQRLHLEDLLSFSVSRVASLNTSLKATRKHKQQLQHQLKAAKQELKNYRQELQNTNQELSAALRKGSLTPAEAQTHASFLLAQDVPTKEALARLLSAIYGCPVTSWELPERSTPATPVQASSLRSADRFYSKPMQLSDKGGRVQAQCQELAAKVMQLQIQYQEVAAQSKALQTQFNRLTAQ